MIHLPRTSMAALALTAMTLAGAGARAEAVFDLRNVNVYRNWTGDPETATQQLGDVFNNSDLQTGASYSGGLTTPAALYTVLGSVAPFPSRAPGRRR